MLTPIASPVWAGGTAETIRFGIAANTSPKPTDIITLAATTSRLRGVEQPEDEQPGAGHDGPDAPAGPWSRSGRPATRHGPGEEHHERAGEQQQPGAGGVEAEAVAARRRRLGELRDAG